MAKKKFYGVAGANGYGVYDKYGRVLASRPFITKFTLKSFHDFSEAKTFAVNTYEEFQNDAIGSYEIESLDEKNWFYYRKLMDKDSEKAEDLFNHESVNIKRNIEPFTIGI